MSGWRRRWRGSPERAVRLPPAVVACGAVVAARAVPRAPLGSCLVLAVTWCGAVVVARAVPRAPLGHAPGGSAFLAAGDTLVVPVLDRYGRSLQDLITMVGELRKQEIGFTSLHERPTPPRPAGGWYSTSSMRRRSAGSSSWRPRSSWSAARLRAR
ncbi:recombinase family protein [Streptomyces sp. NBC_01476]|uniref:recombinase family protein n=1 Tax=Streptomyces sp. NBC_01476 TaxID=2903881 RepID=UPI003FCE19CE